jgi:hypothetical protein
VGSFGKAMRSSISGFSMNSLSLTQNKLMSHPEGFEICNAFASEILIPKVYIWPLNKNQYLQTATYLVKDVHALGLKGSHDAEVKLLPCDHEVMSSSSENSLLQKCKKK